MKPYINFFLFIIALVLAYTVYGIFTFQPDEPRSFVFNEPKLPADLIQQDEVGNDPSDSTSSTAGVAEAQKAITIYRDIAQNIPSQAKDTFNLLIDRMTESSLPLYFLSGPDPQKSGMRHFEILNVTTDNALIPKKNTRPNLNCQSGTPINPILVGTSAPDIIQCDTAREIMNGQDFIMIGGPENDQITDATGNRIVNGGTGDDIIKLGAGRNIIVLDESWGKDTLTVDCTGGMIAANEIPANFPIPWIYRTSNFIVLGKGINPADVVWKENVLTNQVTGDTLTVSQNCFTVVPKIQ